MEVFKDVLIIIICILIIAKGAAWLVDSAAKIARRFGISELVIGLTIVSMGTSAPEFGVTILAALRGMGDISVGNIVGSNIFNLGFILGGTAIVHSLKTNRTIIRRDGAFLFFGTILLTALLWDLSLTRIEGCVLFSLLIFDERYAFTGLASGLTAMWGATLAERAGCTRQTIIALEAGKYTPSLSLAFRIARSFDCRVEEVFTFEAPGSADGMN